MWPSDQVPNVRCNTDLSASSVASCCESSKNPQPMRRAHSRGIVHPAYAPLDVPESVNGDGAKLSEEPSLHVLVRTRDGGRNSPSIATPTLHSPVTAWPTQTRGSVSPLYCSPVNLPSYEFPASLNLSSPNKDTMQREVLPPTVVHQALHGRCRFIPFPVLVPFDPTPPPTNSFPLFIGQVRFETTPAELLWLFHRASGACAITVETRGTGCFIVHFKSESERCLVRQLHKRVLFDIGGVWLARTPEEIDSLCEYVTLEGPYLSKQAKLPRDSMVVEDIRVDYSDATPSYPFYYNGQYGGGVARSPVSSKTSTPTRSNYLSKSSSLTMAPMPPSYPRSGMGVDGPALFPKDSQQNMQNEIS